MTGCQLCARISSIGLSARSHAVRSGVVRLSVPIDVIWSAGTRRARVRIGRPNTRVRWWLDERMSTVVGKSPPCHTHAAVAPHTVIEVMRFGSAAAVIAARPYSESPSSRR